MISAEQNEFLTRTGPRTPMGDLFRRYWIPALLASELPEPDCAPVRVSLLSEKLIAFRDTSGRVGLMNELCPHRGVSLWFGRNEENGLRCPYHGWKYDVNGNCVEVPSEREDFCKRVQVKSYPVEERAGVIWTYMGPPELRPELPSFEWMELPASHVYLSKRWQESNYLQALEGGIDSSHVSFLHSGDLGRDPLHKGTAGSKYALSTKTEFDVMDSAGGLLIGARRPAEEGQYYWRLSQWMMPWYTLIPPYKGNALNGHAWVPMDDENCMAWTMTFHPTRPLTDEERALMDAGHGVHPILVPDGSFRPVANRDNDYLMDREAQKAKVVYSGIKGIAIQDSSLQESMGPIADRTNEHLVSTDKAIVMARAKLRKSALEVQEGGTAPGLDAAGQRVRSASFILPVDEPFRDTALEAQQVRIGEPFVAV
ncbi:Rieske 2Fe-2S domain-containing protein [Flavisphingomonas formosensis]|uniref:Rieske 2Fe-2S domain-containing protein n=1 Tax=Flavisphingomonas formosensis TaxID=861534 RepID=UPI0012FC307A|nr:Rieske 2Fe-2S domain-containing protein [Sphingomonas formosensis]